MGVHEPGGTYAKAAQRARMGLGPEGIWRRMGAFQDGDTGQVRHGLE